MALGLGGYMLAGSVTDYDQSETAPIDRIVVAVGDVDVEISQETAPEASAKTLLGVLLSGGAEITKKDSRIPGESMFKKVGSFSSDCKAGAGAKKCGVAE